MNLTVNGEPVLKEAVEREYQRLLKALGDHMAPEELARRSRQLQRQALDYAIGRRLLLSEARRRAIRIAPEEIDRAVQELARVCGGQAGLRAHLEKLALSPDGLRRQILEARQTEQLIGQIAAACPPPTEEEINAYLNEHAHEFLGGDTPPESLPPPAALREQVRLRLTAVGQDRALAGFVADLRKTAVIESRETAAS